MDDGTVFAFLRNANIQEAAQFPEYAEWRLEVDILDRIPLLVADLVQRSIPDVTGVVHENMDISKLPERGLNEAAGKVVARHAAGIGDRHAALFFNGARRSLGFRGIEIIDQNARPFRCKFPRDASSDAAAGAGHERNSSIEPGHRSGIRYFPVSVAPVVAAATALGRAGGGERKARQGTR